MNTDHPCFNSGAHGRYGRMHLPVAPRCNIQCAYCNRRYSCVNESRPGVAAKVVSPREARDLALEAMEKMPFLRVAGIAGPGDPLANPDESLETLRLVHEALPDLMLCMSTNGLRLEEYADDLANLGVNHITITINAVNPAIGAWLYQYVATPSGKLRGIAGATRLLEKQLAGISRIKKHGATIKANMVVASGINNLHTGEVAEKLAKLGVDMMNCIPLLPVEGTSLGHMAEPNAREMDLARETALKWLPQMRHCQRCRADSVGLLGDRFMLGRLEEIKSGDRKMAAI